MTKNEFTRQLADLTGLGVGSDNLAAAHRKLAAALGVELYSQKVLEMARQLAAVRIHQDRFRDAVADAVFEGRMLPSQRPLLHRYFVRDPQGAIRLVNSLRPVVAGLEARSRRAPDGVDPRSFDLDRRIQAHAVQHGIPYTEAFNRVLEAA